jgi:hypothetical protein
MFFFSYLFVDINLFHFQSWTFCWNWTFRNVLIFFRTALSHRACVRKQFTLSRDCVTHMEMSKREEMGADYSKRAKPVSRAQVLKLWGEPPEGYRCSLGGGETSCLYEAHIYLDEIWTQETASVV